MSQFDHYREQLKDLRIAVSGVTAALNEIAKTIRGMDQLDLRVFVEACSEEVNQ